MYKYKLVIADTSCLIVLSKVERIELLNDIFDSVTISNVIKDELGEPLPSWIKVEEIRDTRSQQILELELDRGEASAIALGLEHKNSLLLIDERKGRKVARELGLTVTGTLGVIIRAKEKGLIGSITDEINKLRKFSFRMSEKLIQQIVKKYDN